VVGQIAVPTLIVHAADDPFIRITPETRRKIAANPNITFREVAHGGHCAFVGARNGLDDGYWAESQIVEFLRKF
jgi:predicted alpha/beta-fold hydrolase